MSTGFAWLAGLVLVAACQTPLPPLTGCPASPATKVGDWWVEVGGPGAQFNIEPGSLHPGPNPWLVIVRVQPDPGEPGNLAVQSERLDGAGRADARVNSRMNPANVFREASRAPQLPGGWFLVELSIPESGCWRVVASVDDVAVGSAVIDVVAK